MTKYLSTPTNAVLVEIDMSKHRQEVFIERPEGGRRRRMTVMATKDDYDRLVEELASMARPIVLGFEATGTPSSPCFKMNAFCASENIDAFMLPLLLPAGKLCGKLHL